MIQEPVIDPEKKKQLDSNIQGMIKAGATKEDIDKYTSDFKASITAPKKKESSSLASPSKQVPAPSSSASVGQLPKQGSDSSDGKSYRLPNDEDYKELQRRGIVEPPSQVRKSAARTENLYDLDMEGNPLPKKPEVDKLTAFAKRIGGRETSLDRLKNAAVNNKSKALPKFKTEKEADAFYNSEKGKDALYDLTPNNIKKAKQTIDEDIEINDLNLEHPYLYFSTYDKLDTRDPVTGELVVSPKDEFVNMEYGEQKLVDLGINPADFDGFLNRKGYKSDYLGKQQQGLFDGSGRNWQGADIQLAKEREKQRMLMLYIQDANQRKYTKDALTAEKDNFDRSYDDRIVAKPTTNFDPNKVTEYIAQEMPLLTKKLKERDEANREILDAHKGNDAGFWYGAKKTLESGFNGLTDRINNIASTSADKLGMGGVADNIRMMHEERLLERPDTREVGYVSGKHVKQGSSNYIVDADGQIYDEDKKIRVTDVFSPKERETIIEKSKSGEEAWIFSPQGTAIQGGRVLGDMLVQIALTRGASTALNAAVATGSSTMEALAALPVSRSMSSAIVAQTALGYSSGLEDTLKAAKDAGINDSDARMLAADAAQRMALLYAVTAPISPQTKATEALFGGSTKSLIKKALTAYSETGKKGYLEVMRNGLSTLAKQGAEFSEEGLKELFQENIQQVGEVYGVNAATNEAARQTIMKDTISGADFVNTSILSFATAGLTSQMRMPGLFKNDAVERLRALQELSGNQDFESTLKQMVHIGAVTNEEAKTIQNDVRIYHQQSNTLPPSISPDVAMPVMKDLDAISKLTAEKKVLDKAFHPRIDVQIEGIRQDILNKESFSRLPKEEKARLINEVAGDNTTMSEDKIVDRAIKLYNDEKTKPRTESAEDETTASSEQGQQREAVPQDGQVTEPNITADEQNTEDSRPEIREQLAEGGQGEVESGQNSSSTPDATTSPDGQSENVQPEQEVIEGTVEGTTEGAKEPSIEVVDKTSFGQSVEKATQEAKRDYYSVSDRKINLDAIKKRLSEAVKKGNLSTGKSAQLVKAAMSLNIDNDEAIDKFFNRFAKAMVLAEKKVQLVKLKADRARVKSQVRTKLNRDLGEAARNLANLKIDNVPDVVFEEYAAVMDMLSKGKNIDKNRVADLWLSVEDAYLDQVDERYEEKLNSTPDKPSTLKEQVLLVDAIDNMVVEKEAFTSYENAILKRFQQIPKSWLVENLSKRQMSELTKAIDAIGGNIFLNKTLNTIVDKYVAQKAAKSILANSGKYVGFVDGFVDKFKSFFTKKKDFSSKEFQDAISKAMLQHINTVVDGIKGTVVYDEIIHPITANLNKANVEEDLIEKEHAHLLASARNSREGSRLERLIPSMRQALNLSEGNYYFEFDVLRQLYYREKEFRDNPDKKGTKVNSVSEHMEAMLDSKDMTISDLEKEVIFKLYNEYADKKGNIDLEKLESHFNTAEKAVISFEEGVLADEEHKNREVNDHRKGESLVYTRSYFPRKSDGSSFVDDLDVSKRLQGYLGSTSVKAGASNSRKAVVEPLDFKTSRNFMTHVKDSKIEYNLSDVVKRSGMIISELKKSDNEGIIKMATALDGSIKTLLESQFRHNPYSPKSKAMELWRATVKNTANKMLIDAIRGSVDTVVNWGTFYTAYADRIPEMVKATKIISKDFMTKTLLNDFGSTQAERLYGSHEVDYRTGVTSSTGKSKFGKYKPTVFDNFIDLYKKNKLTDFAQEAAKVQYSITDKPAAMIWRLDFVKKFKEASGKDFDMEAYSNDPDYKLDHEAAIKSAIAAADKSTTNLFNTSTKAEQKLAIQASQNYWIRSFDSFMKSFSFNENKVFWDSLYSMFGKGTMSKEDAARAFFIVNTRSLAYTYAMQTAITYILAMTGMDDDDEVYEKAWRRSLASHAMLVGAGNKGTLYNIAAGLVIEGLRAGVMKESGEKYDPYEDAVLYVPPSRGTAMQYVGLLGAEGSAIQSLYKAGALSADLISKLEKGEEITKEELIELKAAQITASLISQTTGLPIDRTGKLLQKSLESSGKDVVSPGLENVNAGTIFK